jgi:L-ascorbate metabolism protein UlaG (beta-lactamase superfamily)
MSTETYFLDNNIIAEPVVNNWYAWCNLISPATAAMMQAHHIKLLESYLESPSLHKKAVKLIEMKGGPFLDFKEESPIKKTETLLEKMKLNKNLYALHQAILDLNRLIQKHPDAGSLSSIYDNIPAPLKGFVELVYDLNNNISFRIIEKLLYQENFSSLSNQQIILYRQNSDDGRAFILSTPRLAKENEFTIPLTFQNKLYDQLFSSRTKGLSKKALLEMHEQLETNIERDEFLSLFHQKASPVKQKPEIRNKVKVTYFGHACVLVEASGISILVDPLISYNNSQEPYRHTFSELPNEIDYVLITHAHQDHAVLETLLQIRSKIRQIVVPKNNDGALQDPSLKLFLQHCGFKNIIQMDSIDEITFKEGKITTMPFFGEHADLDIRSKTNYLITLFDKNILFLSDSNNISHETFAYMKKHTSTVDLMFIGMECEGAPLSWLYGPLMLSPLTRKENSSRRLEGSDCKKAFKLVKEFQCKEVYVYAMGSEPWVSFISSIAYDEESLPIIESNKFMKLCHESGIKATRPYCYAQTEL